MSTPLQVKRPKFTNEVIVTGYDRVSAFLVAAILIVGFLVGMLFLIWVTSIWDFSRRAPVQLIAVQPAGDSKPEGYEDDVLEPGVEEFPEIDKPQLKDALEAVTDAVSSVKAALEKRDGDAALMGAGRGFGSRDGGPGNGNGNVLPEHKRWKIEYEASDVNTYARQLDFFNLEIGVVFKNNNNIERTRNFSGAPQKSVSSRKAENKTLRFEHEKARLRRWDKQLASRAGADSNGAITVQFYPESTRAIIRQVELQHLQQTGGRTLEQVRRTFFKIVPDGNGFKYEVTNMLFRL